MSGPLVELAHRIAIRDVGVQGERHRCVGVVLNEIGKYRLAGQMEIVAVLEALATRLEHPELEP